MAATNWLLGPNEHWASCRNGPNDGIEETSTHLACQPICSNCSDIAFWCQIPMPYAGGVSIMSDFERIKVAGSGGTCPC